MGNWSQENDERQDSSDWNRRIKRAIVRYQNASTEENTEEKRNAMIRMVELFEEDIKYELDTFKLGDEQYDIGMQVKDILTGKWQPRYEKSQADWNKELSEALEQGELISTLKLIQIGRKLSFVRDGKEPYETCYSEIKKRVNSISRELDRDER